MPARIGAIPKMKTSSSLLLRILQSRPEPWSLSELQDHPALSDLNLELTPLLRKLAHRGYVSEITRGVKEHGLHLLDLRYTASGFD